MSSNKISNFNFTLIKRVQPKNGPSSSNAWNDSMDELLVDLSNIASQWNNQVKTVLNTLPDGSLSTAIDAFANGLDGTSMWANASASSDLVNTWLYDSVNSRHLTVQEALVYLKAYIDQKIAALAATIPV